MISHRPATLAAGTTVVQVGAGIAVHAVACVKDGDRGRTLRSCALWRALVEFYGEGKGGSNPEGEVVEDEVRGPTVWSVSVFRARPGRRVLGTTRAMHAFPFIPVLFPTFVLRLFVTLRCFLMPPNLRWEGPHLFPKVLLRLRLPRTKDIPADSCPSHAG